MVKIKDKIIGLKELRENTEEYISEIEKGKSFIVMRKSRPVFTISPVDEWGDEGMWETVVDFTKINKNGVGIDDVIKSLKKLSISK
jgi:antitoxin (DNA-binding transcriptional repressor) of toxin-antitoxin stability system